MANLPLVGGEPTVRVRDLLFWDVDTQVDFMLPGGKLYVAGAERIIPQVEALTQFARRHHILVLASADAHLPDDAEFALYPPHCLAGHTGQQKVAETRLERVYVIPNVPVTLPESFEHLEQVVVEKQELDVFSNPNLDRLLAHLQPREVVLYGVVTELCVQYAARGLLARGIVVHVVADAIRALDEARSRDFLSEVPRRGGKLTTTAEVLARAPVVASR